MLCSVKLSAVDRTTTSPGLFTRSSIYKLCIKHLELTTQVTRESMESVGLDPRLRKFRSRSAQLIVVEQRHLGVELV